MKERGNGGGARETLFWGMVGWRGRDVQSWGSGFWTWQGGLVVTIVKCGASAAYTLVPLLLCFYSRPG